MSQLAEGLVSADTFANDINLISDFLDRLQIAAKDQDPLQRLRTYQAMGKVASGILDIAELFPVETEVDADHHISHLAPVNPVDQPTQKTESPQLVSEPSVHDIGKLDLLPKDLKVGDQAGLQLDVDVSTASQDKNTQGDLDQIRQHFSDLKITDREAVLLQKLCARSGQVTRASDLYTGIEGSLGGIKQSTSKFIRKLAESPYGQYLTVTGHKAGTRYMWQGHGYEAGSMTEQTPAPEQLFEAAKDPDEFLDLEPTAFVDDEVIELRKPAVIKETQPKPGVDPMDVLREVGIYRPNEDAPFHVKGVDLHLTDFASKVLEVIAQHGNRLLFKDLLADKSLVEAKDSNAARMLHEALSQIGRQMDIHSVPWRNVELHENGRKIRRIELGVIPGSPTTPPESSSFLV